MSTLVANPILDEIKGLHGNESSGILRLTGDNGQRVDIYFREGMIEAVYSNLGGRRLGDYLLKEGYAAPRDIDALEPIARRQKMLLGEAAVRKGLVNHAQVSAAVRRQAIELLDYVFKNGFSVDSFRSDLRSYFAPARISFTQVLLELSRTNVAPLEPPANVRISLADGVDLSRFQWSPQELYVLSELLYPNTFEGLLKITGLPQVSLKGILGVLQGLGVIRIENDSDSMHETFEGGALIRSSEFPFEHLIPRVTNALLNEKVQVAKNESSFASEQFKNLKVQLNEAANAPKVLTISSPDAQDGKSLLGVNLAFSFAMDPGRRVIIVDCDLRNPSLSNYLGVQSEPGLLQYLANGHLSPYCYVRRVQNLFFLTTGGTATNPVEILSMNKMKQLVECLKKDFDTVILDAPPYCPIADARIVTGLSDGLIMVVRRGKTSCNSADHAFKAVDRNKLLGVVFNDVQAMLFHTYYNFGYYEYGNQAYPSDPKIRNTPKNYLKP